MWHLGYPYLYLITPSFAASGGMYFVIVVFLGIFTYSFESQINNRITNSVYLGDTSHYEPSHLDLHCLQKCLSWSAGLKYTDSPGRRGTQLLYRAGTEICPQRL